MTYLLDTGFWYALINRREETHAAVLAVHQSLQTATIYVPAPVLVEVAYLVRRDLGAAALAMFTHKLAAPGFVLVEPIPDDYERAAAIIRQFNDAQVDFVDAILVAIAERMNIKRVLTLDYRHFRMFRPQHCVAFDLLP